MVHVTAMRDELEKIAFDTGDERPFTSTRVGSMPISIEKLLEKNVVAKTKISASTKGTLAAGAALGALGLHVGSKVNQDRKLGRQIRKQQQQGQQGY